jgi:hypothetical protein
MTSKCTDPQRWGAAAEPNFSEDQAEDYIRHLCECSFHAEADKRSQERMGSMAEIASGMVGDRLLMLRSEEVARMRGMLNKHVSLRRRGQIKMLSIRVNGVERALVDLNKENRTTIEVNDVALISVWKPREGDEERDIRLTTYFLSTLNEMRNTASRHSVTLEGGHIIRFEVEGKKDSSALITVDYCKANRLRELHSDIKRMKHRFETALQEVTWEGVLGKAAVAFILFIAVVIVLKLSSGMRQMEQMAYNQGQQQETEKQKTVVGNEEPPNNQVQKNVSIDPTTGGKEAPFLPPEIKRSRKPPANIASIKESRTRPSDEIVQRIYIGNGFDPDLRQALAESLAAQGVSLAESEKDADATLEVGPVRAIRMDVELTTRSHGPLWWKTVSNSEDGSANIKDVAKEIVKDMLNKVGNVKRAGAREPQR